MTEIEQGRVRIIAEMSVPPEQATEFAELFRFTLMAGGMSREEAQQGDLQISFALPEENPENSGLKIR